MEFKMGYFKICVIFIVFWGISLASHFRGAIITWKPGTNKREIIVDYRISWRMTYASYFECDQSIIQEGTDIGGRGEIDCFSNCIGSFGNLYYKCTDYSKIEDWSSGLGTLTKTVIPADENSNIYEFGFQGQAWIDTLNVGGGGDWKLKAKADLSTRPDTGTINTSPTAEIPPIVRLQYSCNNTIQLKVQDADNDVVRCRWAITKDECGDVCNGLPDSALSSDCTIHYESVYSLGWYAVALQVEDFINATSDTPLSSIPVQFLVYVYTSNASCEKSTRFIAPTPSHEACIGVPQGEILALEIVARVARADRSISEIKTVSPLGMTKSEVYNISATDWRVNITWNSSHSVETSNLFCFTAKETSGIESEQRCITLLKDVSPPTFIYGSETPVGRVFPNQRLMTITTDIDIKQTSLRIYIRIYNDKDVLVGTIDASDIHFVTVNTETRKMQFITPSTLKEKETYYFLFDLGVVKGTEYCGADSSPIEDPQFWRITIIDVTPPLITMKTSPRNTNATSMFEWTVNEPVSTECTLMRPNSLSEIIPSCNNTWIGKDLAEGRYTLNIKTTDLEGNVAYQTITWNVDTTPPVVTFTSLPAKESNDIRPRFNWECNEPCTTKCSFLEIGTNLVKDITCFGKSLIWDVPNTSDVKTYTFRISATDNVGNTAQSHYNWTTDFAPPEINFCNAGENISVDCRTDLIPSSICNVTAKDNLDPAPKLAYEDLNVGTCGIVRKWTAYDIAGNIAVESQSIHVITQKNIRVIRYPESLSVSCGALDNMTETLISMFEIEHPCDLEMNFTYFDFPNEKCGILLNRTWTIADNCGKAVKVFQTLKILEAKKPVFPEDGQRGVDLNMIMRWQGASSSTLFKLYVWERGLPVPKKPLTETYDSYHSISSLKSGTMYQWHIMFVFGDKETYVSPTWVFETRKFADLVVVSIEVPASGFTDNDCTVKWNVMNIGGIATQSRSWYDAVYISWDDTFQNSKRVKTISQRNLIYPNDGYSSIAMFTLDEREFGNAYIFVLTDLYNYVEELNTTNNVMRSLSTVDVKLTPPPDLQVISIIVAGTRAFSGTAIDILWTVENKGQGPTSNSKWWDKIWWSKSQSIDRESKLLTTMAHYGNLRQNENYTLSATLQIPRFITGDYFYIVQTDAFDNTFEYINENNNELASQTPIYVTLTPPPDLVVRSIECPKIWKTGDTVNVTWIVENIGHDSPESQAYWRDEVTLLSLSNDRERYLGQPSHFKVIKAGESYTSSVHVRVTPDMATWVYNVTVRTDITDNLFEFTYENNNQKTIQINIEQVLTDLKVQNLTVFVEYNSDMNVLTCNWEVQNVGDGITFVKNWIDTLKIRMPGRDEFILLHQTEISTENGLDAGESYIRNVSIDLPFAVYGKVDIQLNVDDIYNSTGDKNMINNVMTISDVLISLRAADLKVLDNITTTQIAQAGDQFTVTYSVLNTGSMDVKNITWTDRVYITANVNNLTGLNSIDKSIAVHLNMEVNTTYNQMIEFNLPYSMYGNYTVVVVSDLEDKIFEGPYTDNNKMFKAISVDSAPVSDLTVSSIVAKLMNSAEGNIVSVTWKVKNIGNSMNNIQQWFDKISFKSGSDQEFKMTLNTYKIIHKLESEAQYQEERNVFLPESVNGNIFLCISVDSDNSIYEANSDQNNIMCDVSPISVRKNTAALLTVNVDKIIPAVENEPVVPASEVTVEFTVKNIGELPTFQSSWIDSVYLTNLQLKSTDELKKNGIRVNDIIHVGILQANQIYSVVSKIYIPEDFIGNPYIHVVAANTDSYEEKNDSNFSSFMGSYEQPILLSFLLPNMFIETNQTLGDLQGGQFVNIEYIVNNNGNYSTQHNWFDSAYISEDSIIDAFDVRLNTNPRTFRLDVNEKVTLNLSFIIPLDMETKSYFLVIVCDSRNDVFEQNENDNEIKFVFNMKTRLSSDVVVADVIAPKLTEFGSTMRVTWKVVNNGSKPTSGYKCDSVYISEDRTWDINDRQLGSAICSEFSLSANFSSELNNYISSPTPNLQAQTYHTLVKSRSNIIDLNLDNNVAIASEQTEVTYKVLSVGSSVNMTLSAYGLVALQIVNVSIDQTLVVNASSDRFDSMNNIYLKGGTPATRYNFDKVSEDPTTASKITSYSDYYILIENTGSLSSNLKQNIYIAAKYAEFEILDINPRSVIADANTTFRISGTLFPSDMTAQLVNPANFTTFDSVKTYIFSSTEAYITFQIPRKDNLTKLQMVLLSQSQNISITYRSEINIVKGVNGFLSVSVESPGRLRLGEEGLFKVNYQNLGDSDILVPLFYVEAIGNGTIRLENELQKEFHQKQYLVFGISENGPAGILPPKSHGSLKFIAKQDSLITRGRLSMTLKVSEMKPEFDTANPFLQMKEEMRLSHYDEESWEPIWNNFLSITGNSTHSALRRMSSTLNEMSIAGRRVRRGADIVRYLVEFADAPFGDRVLAIESDFNVQSNTNVRLMINRFMSSRIGSRRQKGAFGDGWIIPLWDTKIIHVDEFSLKMEFEKENYEFIKVDEDVYFHTEQGVVTNLNSEFVLRRHKDSKEFRFDEDSLKLQSVVSLVDQSNLTLLYEKKSLLSEIHHSDGPYVVIKYNKEDRVDTMELVNSTSTGDNKKILYNYDFESSQLREVVTKAGTTRYSYNYQDSSLKYVTYTDGSMSIFEYNNFGHVSARRFIAGNRIVSSQEYMYSDGCMLSVLSKPDENNYNLTFSEKGDIILVSRKGFMPDKTIFSKNMETTYEGDMVVTRRTYDEGGRSLIIEDGNNDRIEAVFNEVGQLETFRDGGGNTYHITLNDNGTLANISYPDGSNKTYRYMENGHSTTTQTGAVKRYEYNEQKQLVMKDIGNNKITSYAYDNIGNVVKAANERGEIEITYEDSSPRSIKYPQDTINYKYNENNQLTHITSSSGYNVQYRYNEQGLVHEVLDKEQNVILQAEYSRSGKIVKKQLGNGAFTKYEYDDNTALLKSLSNFYPNGSLVSFFNYSYSIRNRRISMTTLDGIWKFKYDRAGQVISMTDPEGNVTKYVYDNRKNRKIVSRNGVENPNTINQLNQYMKYGNTYFKYDKNGNVIEKNSTNQEQYTFDEDNKLFKYQSDNNQCEFHYDALGNLHSKACNGKVTDFLIDPTGLHGSNIIEQVVTEDGIIAKTYFYHGGEQIGLIAAKPSSGEMNFFMYDPLGSVVNILSKDAVVLNSYKRNPFGEALYSSERVKTLFTFVGQWGVIDIEDMPGIYLMRSRLYDSYTGRFMSIDPLGLKAHSKNVYAYCSNNPVHFNDPRGTCPWCLLALRGAGIGAGIGGIGAGIGAVKGGFDYLIDTPRSEWTWGGATGAIIKGGLRGALDPFRKVVPKSAQLIFDGVAEVLGNWAEKAINGEAYSSKDASSDFASYIADNSESIKYLNDIYNGVCSLPEAFTGKSPSACDDGEDKVKDIVKDLIENVLNWIFSIDPNDILGPTGYGAARFIRKNTILQYKIRFENEANASAPAQRVYIEYEYNEHLDTRTLLVGEFGFGNFTKTLPTGSNFFQGVIDLNTEMGIFVRVFAGLDLAKKMIIWEFQTVDPNTGEAPVDPGIGFLPPNNGSSGEGFVTFSMELKKETKHLSTVHANASIYFDKNEPIDAPNIFNTVDDSYPDINGTVIADTLSSDSVTLSLKAEDTGSGVRQIDLFQLNDGGFDLLKAGITESFVILNVDPGMIFSLLPIPIDQVGNQPTIDNVDHNRVINITIPKRSGRCECSGNGNCSAERNACDCFKGFYGTNCNSTVKPLEPPVLQLRGSDGLIAEKISLIISAKNMSGNLEDMHIIVSNFPKGTTFSKGHMTDDGELRLEYTDFGQIDMIAITSGKIDIKVRVIQVSSGRNITRFGEIAVMVSQRTIALDILSSACFFKDSNGEILAKLNASVKIYNASIILSHIVWLSLPPWVQVNDIDINNHVLTINDKVEDLELNLTGHVKPFRYTVDVFVETRENTSSNYTRGFEVSEFCEDIEEKVTVPPNDNEKATLVLIVTDILVPVSVNFLDVVAFNTYKTKVENMLSEFYHKHLGSKFIRTDINSLRRGSLIIDHIVITKNDEETLQLLAVALIELPKAKLVYEDTLVAVTSVSINNITDAENVCKVFTSIYVCDTANCTIEDDKPRCSSSETDSDSNDLTMIVIILAVSIPAAIIVLVLVVCLCLRKRKSREEEEYRFDRIDSPRRYMTEYHEEESSVSIPLKERKQRNDYFHSDQENRVFDY